MNWPDRRETSCSERAGPLRALRVLDFSGFLPGPYCTQILADLGADVIKVEPPNGDPGRGVAGGLYSVVNRNKRSIVVDLKDLESRTECLKLVKEADVLIEGFRPGVAGRLGIGYEDVKHLQPSIVYCSISGFGQTGPMKDRPGHDLTYLAATGGLSFSPHWFGSPRRSGIPIADLAGATYAAIAILATLYDRQNRTGEGDYLDVSIADAAMAFVSPRGGPNLSATNSDRFGVYPTNDVYETRDGELVAVAAVEEKFWRCLRDNLVDYVPNIADSRFDSADGRHGEHGDELATLFASAFLNHTAEEWIEIFEGQEMCIERVVSLPEAVEALQAKARGIVVDIDGERHLAFPVIRNLNVMGRVRSRASRLGEHTNEVTDRARGVQCEVS